MRRDRPVDQYHIDRDARARGAAGVRDRHRARAAVRHERVPRCPRCRCCRRHPRLGGPQGGGGPRPRSFWRTYISRIMRGSMVEVLESEVRHDGAPEGAAGANRHLAPRRAQRDRSGDPWGHRLQLAWMAGGVVVVEFVFQYPGIGAALVDAVAFRDMPVVQTVTMLAAGSTWASTCWPTSRRSWSLRSSGRPADEPASRRPDRRHGNRSRGRGGAAGARRLRRGQWSDILLRATG